MPVTKIPLWRGGERHKGIADVRQRGENRELVFPSVKYYNLNMDLVIKFNKSAFKH